MFESIRRVESVMLRRGGLLRAQWFLERTRQTLGKFTEQTGALGQSAWDSSLTPADLLNSWPR